MDDACAATSQFFALLLHRIQSDPQLAHHGRIAEREPATADSSSHTDTGCRLEALNGIQREPLRMGCGHDRLRKRMLAALVEARGKPQRLLDREVPDRNDPVERRASFRERSGLVGGDDGDRAQGLHGGQAPDDGVPVGHPSGAERERQGHYRWQRLGHGGHGQALSGRGVVGPPLLPAVVRLVVVP